MDTHRSEATIAQDEMSRAKPQAVDPEPMPKEAPGLPKDSNHPTENQEEHFARRAMELERNKASNPDYHLDKLILDAERALYGKQQRDPLSDLTSEEQALMDRVVELARSKDPRAAAELIAAIDKDSSPTLYLAAGNLLAQEGNIDRAIDFYVTGLNSEIEPSDVHANRMARSAGVLLVKMGDYERAREYLQTAVYTSPKPDATAHGLLALSSLNTGDLDAAEYNYRRAVQADPSVRDWQIGLARVLMQQEEYEEAIALMKEVKSE